MPIQIKAGTPSRRATDPKSQYGKADARGLYGWSLFEARLVYRDGTADVEFSTAVNGDSLGLLLFTCDVPIICKGISGKGVGTTSPYLFDVLNVNLLGPPNGGKILVTESGGSTEVTSGIGVVSKGFTGAAFDVPCSGFYGGTEVLVNGGGLSVANAIDVQVWANSGGMIGPISVNNHSGFGSPATPQPIILQYEQYTDAIRAGDPTDPYNYPGGNVFVADGDGYLVVGLHNLPLPV